MLPSLDEFNDVLESLLQSGTRYRTEKIAVVGLYLLVVGVLLVWVLSGVELGTDLEGTLETEGSGEFGSKAFIVKNTGSGAWHDVRIVLNGRYLAKVDEVPANKQYRFEPPDFTDYFHVPRPWGHATWERIGASDKPGRYAPNDLEVRDVAVRAREGDVNIELKGSS